MDLKLHVWRQKSREAEGRFVDYDATGISPDASFLEMLDVVHERLIEKTEEPIHFEHDCREGICGSCGMMINGTAHGPIGGTATCQLHMRHFKDGDTITLEPFRARGFPVVKDLAVDRGAFDRIIQAGGYVTVGTGAAPDANATPVAKNDADRAFDAAACIGCGACVAVCPNAAAMLFTGAKVTHLASLPQGQAERYTRVVAMTEQMDREGFGGCTNPRECVRACPKGIQIEVISQMNRDLVVSQFKLRE